MRVRKLHGNEAGLVVDLPDHAAQAEIQFGTAELVNEDPAPATAPSVGSVDETDDVVDTATHKLTIPQVKGMVAAIDDVAHLRALHAGEQTRTPRPRKGVLDMIEERLGEISTHDTE